MLGINYAKTENVKVHDVYTMVGYPNLLKGGNVSLLFDEKNCPYSAL